MKLFTIVYVSIASHEMTDDALLAILEKAKQHNNVNAITGILLFRDGFFIQALEGYENSIDTLFERINKDPRHYNVLQIYKKPISRRFFSGWAMGFETPNFERLQQTPGYSDFMLPRPASVYQSTAEFDNEVEELLATFRC